MENSNSNSNSNSNNVNSLNAGEHIYILLNGSDAFTTEVCEISDISFTTSRVSSKGAILDFTQNDCLDVFYYRDSGIYSFNAVIEEFYTQYGMPMVRFRIISETLKKQRRLYNRIEKKLPVSIILNVTQNDIVKSIEIEANTIDISVGGSRIMLPQTINNTEPLKCKISLNNNTNFTAESVVVHVSEDSDENKPIQIGVKFTKMNERSKRNLARYVYEEQSKLVKKSASAI